MKAISFLDLLSHTPNLRINNSEKYYTFFGLLISLLTIIFGILIVAFYFINCISRKNFKILEKFDRNSIPTFDISKNLITLIPMDVYGREIEDTDRLITFEGQYRQINPRSDKGDRVINENIPITNCSIYLDSYFKKDVAIAMKNWKYIKCLDLRNLKKKLSGKYGGLKRY